MALPISKDYLLTQLRNFKSIILDPAYIIQKSTLPTAGSANEGAIFQYIGSDSTHYTIGGFYQCQEVTPATDPKTYTWVEVSTRTLIDENTIQRNVSTKELYVPDATASQKGVMKVGHGLAVDATTGETKVIGHLEEIDALPTAAATNEGKIYLLTDVQTGYDRGGIYMCEESTETAGTYEWKLISMSPLTAGAGITIADDKINADTNVFNGTIDEFEALPADQQAQYSHIASPDEATADGDTEWVILEKTSAVVNGVIKAIRKGNIVTVSFNNIEATVTNYDCTLVTALPTKYRPPSGAGIVMSICGENPDNSNAIVLASCYISHAGVVMLQPPHIQNGTIKYASAVMTYPAGY